MKTIQKLGLAICGLGLAMNLNRFKNCTFVVNPYMKEDCIFLNL